MAWYLVSLAGHNLYLKYKGELSKYGFHTKRHVEADNEDQAESEALRIIMNDPELHSIIQNRDDDPPTMSVERIQKVERPKIEEEKNIKNLFYKEHEA